jgi:hypothetical protein
MEKARSLLNAKLQVNYTILSSVCQPNFNEFFKQTQRKEAYFEAQKGTDRIHFDEYDLFGHTID